jgi:MOSC domain-containing protein YiiM
VPTQEVYLSVNGFAGDGVENTEFHGGLDRAVCAYPFEHYDKWEREFQKKLPKAAFGENVTVLNMSEEDVYIGDIYQFGEAILQVTQGRIPCATISKKNELNQLLPRIVDTGFTGYFFRVLQDGWIRSDSTITCLDRHPAKVSVLFGNQIMFHDRKNIEGIQRILEIQQLADAWRKRLTSYINKARNAE